MTTKSPIKKTSTKQPKRTTKKISREYDVSSSDRIDLIRQANEFVNHIVVQKVYPKLSGLNLEVELSQQEEETYNAVLLFLKRQFDIGFKDRDVAEKKIESEETVELS